MHHRPQNSGNKKAKMQKKAENAFQFENSCKKKAKMHSQFRNSYKKKNKNGKKESTFIWIFSLLYPLFIFLHFKPKNSYKKGKNAKKKTFFFQIRKIYMQKKSLK